MAVVNYRNRKLFLNKGSCVLTDSKWYVFKHCTNTTGCTQYNISLCIQCVEYIDRNTVYKGMIATHHKNHLHILNLQLRECIQPKQSLAPLPPQHPPFTTTSPNHSQIFCCCQELAPPFFFTTVDFHNITQSPLWFPPKASNIFVTSSLQPAFSASCRQ